MRTLVALSDRVLADVSTNPPNLADVPKVLADPGYQTASTNVTRYAAVHCGSLSPPTTAP